MHIDTISQIEVHLDVKVSSVDVIRQLVLILSITKDEKETKEKRKTFNLWFFRNKKLA